MENSRIEYKRKLTDELEKEVVAFLNSDGGVIYIGRDEEQVYELGNLDELQLKIKDRLKTILHPLFWGFLILC